MPPGAARLRLRRAPHLQAGRGYEAIGARGWGEPAQWLRPATGGHKDGRAAGGRWLMAAPQRRYRATLPTEPAWPAPGRALRRSPERSQRKKAAGRRRRFAMLVVVPVLLMLGSVYLHTVAAGLDARAAELGAQLGRAREVGERLEVKVAELSGAERIRALAAEKLGMHEPKSTTLKVYGVRAEDGKNDGAPQEGGRPRRR